MNASRPAPYGNPYVAGIGLGLVLLAAFVLTNPYALLAFPVFWSNVTRETAIARGLVDVPYTRQFHTTWPYVYPIMQQLRKLSPYWGENGPVEEPEKAFAPTYA